MAGRREGLEAVLERLALCPPAERISLREDALAHGSACVSPLVELAQRQPDLVASTAAWLERLAVTDEGARADALAGLRRLASGPDGRYARDALARLIGARSAPIERDSGDTPRPLSGAGEAVYSRLVKIAKEGRIVSYSELETSRGHIGKYLHQILLDESAAGRPPLTAIVVQKQTGRPGDGFLPAMVEAGFAHAGENEEAVWQRAVAAVHKYWRGRG